jgi:predicted dehydrogenase
MTQGTRTPLGVGIIGTGFGLMHLLGFRKCENVRFVAVCQRTPGKAEAFAQRFIHGVRTGQPVTPSFFEGLKSQEVLDAIVQSVAEQRWVKL